MSDRPASLKASSEAPAQGFSRREFVKSSAGASLMLGLGLQGGLVRSAETDAGLQRGVYLNITPAGRIIITPPTSELGQGIHNALPRILADELGADWDDVDVAPSYADEGFVAEATGRQRTAASEGVKIYLTPLRQLGASAREMLRQAAATAWDVPVGECEVAQSRVVHQASVRQASFGELAAAAGKLSVPESPVLKDPKDFTYIGKSAPRKDLAGKIDGSAVFGIDVVQPDMLHAALAMPARFGARITGFDGAEAKAMRGVAGVVAIDNAVAVVADSFWRAKQAAATVQLELDESAAESLDSESLSAQLQTALADDDSALQFPDIDTQASVPALKPLDRDAMASAMDDADQVLELDYEVPYLAHLTMEPMVCTALVTEDRCHIWAPSQHPDGGRALAAELTGLPIDKVRFDITYVGGGFGRKWELDTVSQVVQIAKAFPGSPVKLTWTREQDVQHDFYRPGFATHTRIALKDGALAGMHSRIAGQSVWRFQDRNQIPGTADPTVAALLVSDIYDFPGKYIDFVETPWRIPVGLWRSVTLSQNSFFAESAIDEAAVALQRDPLAFRRELLAAHPRIVAVLDAAAEMADWERQRPPGHGLGVAISQGFGSVCVQIAEVLVTGNSLKLAKIYCAFDCGLQIDPDNIHAQLEGGIVFGLSAALRGDITFDNGAVRESNFNDQPVLRINETPEIAIKLLDSDAPPGGVGEAGVPPVAPALVNAIATASGRRLRRLPLLGDTLTLA